MSEPLVIVPATRPRHQGEFWLIVTTIVLWLFQGTVGLAANAGYVVPRWLAFSGAVAGLLFAGLSMLARLASPETISGFDHLDQSTRDASFRWRGR